ncbi:MAG: hypothetical protein OHK0023_24460 [Anaerolineae bacterium]
MGNKETPIQRRQTALLDPETLSKLPTIQPFYSETQLDGWRVTLVIQGDIGKSLHIDVAERAMIGRPDASEDHAPDVDLAPFGARDRGVSRRHAEIVVLNHQLHLCDLGSTNGTWLNGQLLYPRQYYKLQDGDLIQCGSLQMVLKLR